MEKTAVNSMMSRVIGILISASVFFMSGAAWARDLKLAHFMPAEHILHRQVFVPLAEQLAQASKGDLKITIYPSGALGKGPAQQYKRAVEGVADITFCIQSYTASLFPRSLLLTQPGVADTAEEGTRKFWDIYDAYLKNEYAAVKVLGIWVMSPPCLITRSKPIRTVADLQGMKVRIGSPLISQLIISWGGVPVAMPVTEAYNALNTGIVDAVLVQPSALYESWNLAEAAKYVIDNVPGTSSMAFLAMNRESWNSLSPEQQAILEGLTGREFSLRAGAVWGSLDIEGLENARRDPNVEYMRLTPTARAGFEKAAQPAINADLDQLEKQGIHAREIYNAITH
jgi:TRAP-type C4-dicarboxylate transport system substrate-binding protein